MSKTVREVNGTQVTIRFWTNVPQSAREDVAALVVRLCKQGARPGIYGCGDSLYSVRPTKKANEVRVFRVDITKGEVAA